jgi:hypothetical protein
VQEEQQINSSLALEKLAAESLPMRNSVMESGAKAKSAFEDLYKTNLNEPPRAKKAFMDYVALGRGRSLKRLAEDYSLPTNTDWTQNFESNFRTLKRYSSTYQWQYRLRMVVARASAEILAAAQRDAFVHAKDRINLARQAQEAAMTIIDKANLAALTEEEARKMLKPAATLLQLGLTSERAEQGDMLTVIRPEKPVEEMTDDELQEFAETMQKALQ